MRRYQWQFDNYGFMDDLNLNNERNKAGNNGDYNEIKRPEKSNNKTVIAGKNVDIKRFQQNREGIKKRTRGADTEMPPIGKRETGWMRVFVLERMLDTPDGFSASEVANLLWVEAGYLIAYKTAITILNDIVRGLSKSERWSVETFKKRSIGKKRSKGKSMVWSYKIMVRK